MWVLLGLTAAGLAFYLGRRSGMRSLIQLLGFDTLNDAHKKLEAVWADRQLLVGTIGTLHSLYCEEWRPQIQQWVEAWPEFDWGSVEELIEEPPPSLDSWLALWRWDTLSHYEGHHHRYMAAILELHAAVQVIEPVLEDLERDDVIKEYAWGNPQLMGALRVFRAFIPHLETPRTVDDEPPDLDWAYEEAESDDEREADDLRSEAIQTLSKWSDTLGELVDLELQEMSLSDLQTRATELTGCLQDQTLGKDEVAELQEELGRIRAEIAARSQRAGDTKPPSV